MLIVARTMLWNSPPLPSGKLERGVPGNKRLAHIERRNVVLETFSIFQIELLFGTCGSCLKHRVLDLLKGEEPQASNGFHCFRLSVGLNSASKKNHFSHLVNY